MNSSPITTKFTNFLYFCSNYVLHDLRSLLPSCFHHCAFTHYALPVGLLDAPAGEWKTGREDNRPSFWPSSI